MNRKWLLGGVVGALALAAILALVVGGVVGRSIVPDPAPSEPATTTFRDTLTDVSITYPSGWQRRVSRDQAVRILVATPDQTASASVSVRKSELEDVTAETLPVVRPLTDDLLKADDRITSVNEPEGVTIGGLPGWRYEYSYRSEGTTEGAHIHYFLFKRERLIQIVLQAVPASLMPSLLPTLEQIATSFRDGAR